MNKLDFLRKLDKYLEVLDREERREILSFYEERFYTGTIYENKTEAEVIAELESPEAIARNVLAEYGASPKYVKVKEERNSNINMFQLIVVLAFDVFIAAWLIPTLFSVAVSLFGSVLTYPAVIPMILGDRSTVDEFVFFFLTGGYVMIFLFALVVLDLLLYVTKKVIIWNLNVFKLNNRDKLIKRLSRISVEGWFKRHPKLRNLKNILAVAAIVTLAYTGYWMINHNDWVRAEYQSDVAIDEVITEDFTAELTAGDAWIIETDLEDMEIEVVLVDSDEFVIKHTALEEDEFTYTFDTENNILSIDNDYPNFGFVWSIEDIFSYVEGTRNRVIIEIPKTLALSTLDLETSNGVTKVNGLETDVLSIETSNSRVILNDLTINTSLTVDTSNGDIIVRRVSAPNASLDVESSNGAIDFEEVTFNTYTMESSNGRIELSNLNVTNKDGSSLFARTSNGRIDMENVYVDDIDIKTSNGNIDFFNDDDTFMPTSFKKSTSNGTVSTNVR